MGTAEQARPSVRFGLKAQIVLAGYRTYSQFAEQIGTDLARLSRITNGYEWPSLPVQKRIAKELGLTLRELRELL